MLVWGLVAAAATDTPQFLAANHPALANEGGEPSGWTESRVEDTRFSVDRGFHDEAFALEITSRTPGAEIRYTLDGSRPGAAHGRVYTTPIPIDRTTVVRAAAFKEGYVPTNVDAHTYIFLEDILHQPDRPAGFPTDWDGVRADYEMDPRIVDSPAFAPRIRGALRSLPAFSISTDEDHLFDPESGIYANPERHGEDWERPASVEWFTAEGLTEFQIECGLRIQGGWFRGRNNTRKHSFRLLFKEAYGPGKLDRDLFEEFGAAREFDTLVLRSGANDGYSWAAAKDTEQFLRDEFGRRLHLAMGHPAPRGAFVHLYLNGLYWGLYNVTERPNEDFSASYLGGEPEAWDAINSGEVKSGDLDAWRAMMALATTADSAEDYYALQGLRLDGSRDPDLPVYLDAENYLDYMILNMWGGNWDWPNKNFWFGRLRSEASDGFKFYVWDFENTMGNNRSRSPLGMVAPRSGVRSSWVGEPHQRLKRIEEYRLAFADRTQRHFFPGGALSPEALSASYRAWADRIELAVIAESARWGDDHHSSPQDLDDWRRERDWLLDTYLSRRTAVVLEQFRAAGLYPPVDAPVFNYPEAPEPSSDAVTISTTAAEIFYTTNGDDPRRPGGAPHPAAVNVVFEMGGSGPIDPGLVRSGDVWSYLDDGSNPGPAWNRSEFDDSDWATGLSPLGYGDGDEATAVGFVDADPDRSGMQKNATTHFRIAFEVADPTAFEGLHLTLTYDDAAAVYLNGEEIARTANLAPNAGSEDYATSEHPDNSTLSRTDLPTELLETGRNVIAVEVHQKNGRSSDISFDLELIGQVPGSDAIHTTEPIPFQAPVQFKARARTGDQWSALSQTFLPIEAEPANADNLVISEFSYRPTNPETARDLAVSENRDDYEFIELLNIGASTIDLNGVRLEGGVLYEFQRHTPLAPAERVLLVKDSEAFEARYGEALGVAGRYDGRLSNGGERLALRAANDDIIREFAYHDRAPWPSDPDGEGYSLVLIAPFGNPDHAEPGNWRSSVAPGGNPGTSDAFVFTGDPEADLDGNGYADFVDHAFGTTGTGQAPAPQVFLEPLAGGDATEWHLTVTVQRNRAADDAVITFAVSDRLDGPWREAGQWMEPLREDRLGDGMARVTYRLTQPVDSAHSKFLRVGVARR